MSAFQVATSDETVIWCDSCHTDSCMCQIDGIELVDLVVAVYIVWLNNCEAVVENYCYWSIPSSGFDSGDSQPLM